MDKEQTTQELIQEILSYVDSEEHRETVSKSLGCLIGLHAWSNNRCVNCGKTR